MHVRAHLGHITCRLLTCHSGCSCMGIMFLFQFGFTRASSSCDTENGIQEPLDIPTYLPNVSECGLGVEEHSIVTTSVSELADPEPSRRKRKTRGKYTEYSDEDRAKIGRLLAKMEMREHENMYVFSKSFLAQ